jgi:hypothetical protein
MYCLISQELIMFKACRQILRWTHVIAKFATINCYLLRARTAIQYGCDVNQSSGAYSKLLKRELSLVWSAQCLAVLGKNRMWPAVLP